MEIYGEIVYQKLSQTPFWYITQNSLCMQRNSLTDKIFWKRIIKKSLKNVTLFFHLNPVRLNGQGYEKQKGIGTSDLISATEHLTGKLHKSEVVLITSTLLVEKSETIYQNTAKMYKTMKAEVSHSAAFRSSAARHKDVHGLHQRCDMAEEKIAHLYGEKMVCW